MYTNSQTKTNTQLSNQDNISYRRPEVGEAGVIQGFFDNMLATNFPTIPPQGLHAYKKSWTKQNILKRIRSNTDLLFLAWHKDKPIGLLSGSSPEGGVGTVIWMMVEEEHRNKKIGKRLLSYASQFYQGHGCHKIKLTAPSERAKDFYLKQGMVIEGVHPSHWWKIDFWSLAKIIS